ncbi:MerR family transcriptional regulator [Bacillus massiliigorillae]|uniref:MerR family transcriptional regulator n=1 Tax=Bacillus massiliigorillae TaxID=1243664 RepID=UPI00039D712B|nr:MerR family transcriptional regulator [Bacillus massiliigorillae]
MYLTTEVAKQVNIHPNTVRLYEEWGYISPAPRSSSGYRMFSDVHLFQLQVIRTAFRCEICLGNIRAKARAIIRASGNEDFDLAYQLSKSYLTHLQKEYAHALEAIAIVEEWLDGRVVTSTQTYSRKEAARALEVTPEVVRNWERNGLLIVPRLANGYRAYTENEINTMKIIRTLRTAHYSMSAILRLLNKTEQSKILNVKDVLDTPGDHEDIISVTDRLTHSLEEGIESAHELIRLLKPKSKESMDIRKD